MSETLVRVDPKKTFEDLCGEYALEKWQCDKLKEAALETCPVQAPAPAQGRVAVAPSGRRLSAWQVCIKEYAKSKGWGPTVIKEASKLYREGKCPSGQT